MALIHRCGIFSTFLLSCTSLALLWFCITTDNWVDGSTKGNPTIRNEVLYIGLFRGIYYTHLDEPFIHTAHLTCVDGENRCAYSCKNSTELRQEEVNSFFNGTAVSLGCFDDNTPTGKKVPYNVRWFNRSVYIGTLVFLGISVFFTVMSALFAVFNTIIITIKPIWGIFGLHIWNICSAISSLIALLIWGVHYFTTVRHNLTFVLTMFQDVTVRSILGYSYWTIFASITCHILSEIILLQVTKSLRNDLTVAKVDSKEEDNEITIY